MNCPAGLDSGIVPWSTRKLPLNCVVTLVTFAWPAVGAWKPVLNVPRNLTLSFTEKSPPRL